MRAQQQRVQKGEQCHFIVRKNPHYPRRRQLLPPIVETNLMANTIDIQIDSCTKNCHETDNIDENANSSCYVSVYDNEKSEICKMCRNNFRSCDFCNKNSIKNLTARLTRIPTSENLTNVIADNKKSNAVVVHSTTYNPVYNIREIRSVCNSFSSMGIEKKLLEIDRSCGSRNTSIISCGTTKPNAFISKPNSANILPEAVNNDPAKGYGSYIYI